jgi:hydroxypyruvate isomerase
MMLDLYHAAAMGLDGPSLFAAHTDHIRHVQFAAFPSRNEPDHGAFDVAAAIRAIRRAGYGGAFGAEYRPRMATRDGLDWLAALKRSLSAV